MRLSKNMPSKPKIRAILKKRRKHYSFTYHVPQEIWDIIKMHQRALESKVVRETYTWAMGLYDVNWAMSLYDVKRSLYDLCLAKQKADLAIQEADRQKQVFRGEVDNTCRVLRCREYVLSTGTYKAYYKITGKYAGVWLYMDRKWRVKLCFKDKLGKAITRFTFPKFITEGQPKTGTAIAKK